MTGFAHEYKRHGTTNLFAALNVATGQVNAKCFPRKRREEFLHFLDSVTACHAGKEIHVFLDNLSVHKLKPEHPWIKRHPHIHFHFIPTHAAWLNQIKFWFSILSRAALKGTSFRSVKDLMQAIESFLKAYNETAAPFEWTKIRICQNPPESKYANLIKYILGGGGAAGEGRVEFEGDRHRVEHTVEEQIESGKRGEKLRGRDASDADLELVVERFLREVGLIEIKRISVPRLRDGEGIPDRFGKIPPGPGDRGDPQRAAVPAEWFLPFEPERQVLRAGEALRFAANRIAL